MKKQNFSKQIKQPQQHQQHISKPNSEGGCLF